MKTIELYNTNAYAAIILKDSESNIIGVWTDEITPFVEDYENADSSPLDWDGNGETEFDADDAELIGFINGCERVILNTELFAELKNRYQN